MVCNKISKSINLLFGLRTINSVDQFTVHDISNGQVLNPHSLRRCCSAEANKRSASVAGPANVSAISCG